jgi:hypothetical protein
MATVENRFKTPGRTTVQFHGTRSILGVVVAIAIVQPARGTSYQYLFDQANYTVMPGKTVDVSVYLQEQDGTIFQENGLIGAGVTVCLDSLPQPMAPALVLQAADVTNVSDFDFVWSKAAVPNSGCADLLLGTFGAVYGSETATGADIYRIPLGKFTFTAGVLPGEVTHIRATDYQTDSEDVIYNHNNDPLSPMALDGLICDATATITTLPEPSAVALLAMGALSVLVFGCRRR